MASDRTPEQRGENRTSRPTTPKRNRSLMARPAIPPPSTRRPYGASRSSSSPTAEVHAMNVAVKERRMVSVSEMKIGYASPRSEKVVHDDVGRAAGGGHVSVAVRPPPVVIAHWPSPSGANAASRGAAARRSCRPLVTTRSSYSRTPRRGTRRPARSASAVRTVRYRRGLLVAGARVLRARCWSAHGHDEGDVSECCRS
jgi:hypothetical protein